MAGRTCALIPSYNEAKTIGVIVRALRAQEMPVYVIDDGSSDGTAKAAREAGAVVASHESNKGKGAAIKEGISRALADGFDAILILDGDGQHHTDDVRLFTEKMRDSGADIIIGNRMADTGKMPLVRVATNRFMSFLISRLSGQDIPDTQCGFRLIKRRVLEEIRLESSNYETESEILIKASKRGFRVESVPIMTIYEGEFSGIRPIRDTLRFLMMIFKTMWQNLWAD